MAVIRTLAKIAISYLLAGAGLVVYLQWPGLEGHARIPFATYPEVLLWAPVAPLIPLAQMWDYGFAWRELLSFGVFALLFTVLLLGIRRWGGEVTSS